LSSTKAELKIVKVRLAYWSLPA